MGDIDFQIKRQIDKIASDRNMIGVLRQHIGNQAVQHCAVHCVLTVSQPVDIAGNTF